MVKTIVKPIVKMANLSSLLGGLVFCFCFFILFPARAQVNPILTQAGIAQPGSAATYGLADIERRLQEMEQEGAQRNGATERMQFAIEAIAKRVDDIQKDYDIRLNDLETRLQTLEARPAAMPPATTVAAGASPTAAVSISIPAGISSTVLYNKAYAYLTATQYPQAEAWLLEFTKRFPADKLADNAFYWLGETRLVQNNAAGAVMAFRDGLRAFPTGAKAPDNLFKMGVALEQLKQPQLAKTAWGKLVKDFPASQQASRAKARLAGLKG